jgi:hypothetical protein
MKSTFQIYQDAGLHFIPIWTRERHKMAPEYFDQWGYPSKALRDKVASQWSEDECRAIAEEIHSFIEEILPVIDRNLRGDSK